ncbi:hypothetical protein PR202_ga11702 [Eleusine coracana subsp. coracana]|uniref:Uncharacterized protein n=1 Tax=Eleusine coracana subsp. coracana TaxID=191504 RepID=A0AAV5CAB1_ELECO|nr:hypothetical protein PR202_ga11702 [Eleusine coracana subsp. coracana]
MMAKNSEDLAIPAASMAKNSQDPILPMLIEKGRGEDATSLRERKRQPASMGASGRSFASPSSVAALSCHHAESCLRAVPVLLASPRALPAKPPRAAVVKATSRSNRRGCLASPPWLPTGVLHALATRLPSPTAAAATL